MKKFLLLFLLAIGLHAFAQITISISPSHPNFMQYDAVRMKVYLKNYSSMPITFGQSKELRGELDFIIYHKDRTLLSKRSNAKSVLSGIILRPGEAKTVIIDLAKLYPLQELGNYTVTAIIKHPKLTARYRSNQTSFYVGEGSKYWHRVFGVPDYTGKQSVDTKVPPRTYSVKIFNNGVAQIYFLLVEDKAKVYAIKRLGFDLGPEYRPQLLVDATARLHALLHITQKVFIYYIYNYEGKLEKRQVYLRTTTRPYLITNPATGSIIVDGGRIAHKDVDYEEIKDLPFMDHIERPADDDNDEGFGSFEDFRTE